MFNLNLLVFVLSILGVNNQEIQCNFGICETSVFSSTDPLQYNCDYSRIKIVNLRRVALAIGSFRICRQTRVLIMTDNNIEIIQTGAFLGMETLMDLYLLDNHISTIEAGSFHSLSKLEVFVLTGNRITTLPPQEMSSKNIRHINMNTNFIKELPVDVLKNLKSTEIVDLSNNQLDHLYADSLINLEPGVVLDFSNNKLVTIPLNFKSIHSTNTSLVMLSGNVIKKIDNFTLGFLYKLRVTNFDLSFNYIELIEPEVFSEYTTLMYLHLNHNRLQYLPPNLFNKLAKLHVLDLAHNQLSSQIFQITVPKTVKYLELGDNNIEDITSYEWISRNALENIKISLHNNKLTYIDGNRLSARIKEISLDNNLWSCKVLQNLVQCLSNRGITVLQGTETGVENVLGIHCLSTIPLPGWPGKLTMR